MMKKMSLLIIAMVLVSLVFIGCANPVADDTPAVPEDGTIIVNFTGFTAEVGNSWSASAVEEGADVAVPANIKGISYSIPGFAIGSGVEAGGTIAATLKTDNSQATDMVFTAGATYDIYLLVGVDNGQPTGATSGEKTHMIQVTVDGNMTVTVDEADFTTIP